MNNKNNYLSKSSIQKQKLSKIFLNKINNNKNNKCNNNNNKLYNSNNSLQNNSNSININYSSFSKNINNNVNNNILMSEDEKAIIKYSENYILSLKDLNISKEKNLLNEFIENHINLMNNTIEKIKIENNIIIDNLNIDFSNLDDNIILTTEDLNYENNSIEKNL